MRKALTHDDESLRMAAAHVLLQFTDEHDETVITDVLKLTMDPTVKVRNWMVSRLGLCQGHPAAPAIIAALMDVANTDSEQSIRHFAVLALDKIGAQDEASDIRFAKPPWSWVNPKTRAPWMA